MSYIDITGMKFGYLTVIEEADPIRRKSGDLERRWICKCDCGNTKIVNRSTLKPGTKSSCGCKNKPIEINPGDRFGKLTIIEQCENVRDTSGHMRRAFSCKCDCGQIVIIKGHDFNKSRISCGHCSRNKPKKERKKHKKVIKTIKTKKIKRTENKRLYNIWAGMRYRCNSEKSASYKYYGGRGITVCKEWDCLEGYEKFREWAMKNGYRDNLSIDRINVDGNYCPDNCRWADIITQARNRRNTKNK